jgi:sRNA-binding protein
LEEHEARQKEEANRERRASRDDAEANRNAQDSHTGKKHDAKAPPVSSTPNGNADGNRDSPKDQEMNDIPAEDPGREAVRVEATEHTLDSTVAGHEATADRPSKDNDDDENGEDVVEEAAEDTVIY